MFRSDIALAVLPAAKYSPHNNNNIPLMMSEFRSNLACCRDGAAVRDGLSYPFLLHLHQSDGVPALLLQLGLHI